MILAIAVSLIVGAALGVGICSAMMAVNYAAFWREDRKQRAAIAECIYAMQCTAHETDGYMDEAIDAVKHAAPLVGITVEERPDKYGDIIYHLEPSADPRH